MSPYLEYREFFAIHKKVSTPSEATHVDWKLDYHLKMRRGHVTFRRVWGGIEGGVMFKGAWSKQAKMKNSKSQVWFHYFQNFSSFSKTVLFKLYVRVIVGHTEPPCVYGLCHRLPSLWLLNKNKEDQFWAWRGDSIAARRRLSLLKFGFKWWISTKNL